VDRAATDLKLRESSPLSDELTITRRSNLPVGDLLTIAIFLGTIFGLLSLTILNTVNEQGIYSKEEKRKLAAMPSFDFDAAFLRAFPKKFEAFLNDRFAFRKDLVKGASLVKYAFGVSNSKEVLIGKNNWLYYTDSSDMATLRHTPLFAPEEVAEWARVLEARRIWLAKHGIKFLVVIAPSKFSVYPEFVPEAYTPLNKTSRREQLISLLKKKTSVPYIDLLDTMIKARSNDQVYYKTDTHWNTIGGLVATNKILSTIKPWLPTIEETSLASFRREKHLFVNADLVDLLGLHGIITETEDLLAIHPRWQFSDHPKPDTSDRHDQYPFAQEVDDPKLPKAVFLRDSFMSMLKLFLGDHFRRAAYYWTQDFPTDVILQEKPDIVIEEFVERKLVGEMPTNPAEVDALIENGASNGGEQPSRGERLYARRAR